MKTKIFTVEEANSLLPVITSILDELFSHQQKADLIYHELNLRKFMGENKISMSTESSTQTALKEHRKQVNDINTIVERINEHGCLIKDLEMGLIDFLAEIDGRPVFLCWKYGEPEISYYHELDEGFQGRKYLWIY